MPPTPNTQHPIPTLAPRAAYALWAASYPAQAHNPLMLTEERAMLALLPADLSGLRVLDAGCGSGRYLRHAAQRGAAQLVGVDLSHEMLLRAAAEGKRQKVKGKRPAIEGKRQKVKGKRLADSKKLEAKGESAEAAFTFCFLPFTLIEASLDALPLAAGWADLTICGLTIGHLEDLRGPLAELRRATRAGGTILISDFHPIGAALGWRREFRAGGERYAVRHTAHSLASWQQACADLGLQIISISEPQLDPADIPPGASFDPAALSVPVALVLELRR